MLSLTEVFVGIVAFAFVTYLYKNKSNKNCYNLPPEPWGLPVLGHLLFFGKNPAMKFLEWKKIYGPIFTVRFGSFHNICGLYYTILAALATSPSNPKHLEPAKTSQSYFLSTSVKTNSNLRTVVLNDVKLIKDAFNLYEFSGRPSIHVFNKLANGKGIAFAVGPKQVEQKKFAIKAIREFGAGRGVGSLEQRLYEETSNLFIALKTKIQELDGKSLKMNKLFQITVINSFWVLIMGKRFEENDPALSHLLLCLDKAVDTNSTIVAQLFWFFPWVAKLGDAVGYNPPLHAFRNIYNSMEEQIKTLKKFYVKGQSKHYSDAYFNKVEETTDPNSSFHESDNQQPFSTGDLFSGVVDTTVYTLDWLMIYMARQPDLQAKLQDEIDSIIGLNKVRVPRLSDRSNMPYTNAVIEELLRITTVVPLGLFHETLKDVEFKGYKIPKNTMVISNLYGAHRDPEVWQNPETFDPTRFLNENNEFRKNETNEFITFGTGNRYCPGERFARDVMFLLVTNLFQEFVLSCTENIPSLDSKFGLMLGPLPFELNVKVR